MSAPVVTVIGIFFIIGVAAGMVAVVALSALRADRRRGGGPPEQGPGGPSRGQPDDGREDSVAGGSSRRSGGYWVDRP
jgi:hypothetical protein